ncbi:MAG: tetratricopeptide repeat protein [Bacteriovoracales bacterium]
MKKSTLIYLFFISFALNAKELDTVFENSNDYKVNSLFLKASDASLRGNFNISVPIWEEILRLGADNPFITKKYAVDLIKSGQVEKAKKVLEDFYNGHKMPDPNVGLVLAGFYLSNGQKERARKIYEEVGKRMEGPEAYILLAKTYADEKNYPKAESILVNSLKRFKKHPQLSAYLAGLYLIQKKEQKAMDQLEKILKSNPEYEDAALSLAAIYENKGNSKRAIKIYKDFLKKVPESYTALSNLVRIYLAQDNDIETLDYLEKLSSLDPSNLNLKVKLGILYNKMKRYEDAKGIFKEILEVVPDSEKIQYYLATIYLENKEIQLALEHFSKIPETGSLFRDAQIQTANILISQAINEKGEVDEAASKKFKSFIEDRSSGYPELELDMKILLVNFLENSRNFPEAIKIMRMLEGKKGFGEQHDYYLASLLEKNKNIEEAQAILEKLIIKNPKNASALNFLGYTYLDQGVKLDEAFSLIQRAIKLRPEDGFIRDSLGWYYFKTGDYNKALKEIKKAWEKEKTDVTITLHLALIYQKLNSISLAEKYFAEALKNCKQESEKTQVQQAMAGLEEQKQTGKRLPASP